MKEIWLKTKKKIKCMQEQLNAIIEKEDNEFKAKLLIWQENEADLLKCINKLLKEHNNFLAIITKTEEENIELLLSIESMQLQGYLKNEIFLELNTFYTFYNFGFELLPLKKEFRTQ